MKIRICCDNNANIHSKRSVEIDVGNDLGLTDEEWNELTDNEKQKEAFDYVVDACWIEIWWEEV